MHILKRIFGTLLAIIWSIAMLSAQERLGMSVGNYAGINGVSLNPSSIGNTRKYLEVHILSGSFTLDNNYIFIPQYQNRFSAKRNFVQNALKLDFPGFYDEDYIFDDRFTTIPKSGFTEIRLTGPAGMYSWNGHALALRLTSRLITSGTEIPYDVAKFGYEQRYFPSIMGKRFVHDKSFHFSSVSWSEISLTYSRFVEMNHEFGFAAGISIRKLWSYHGMSFESDFLDYSLIHSDTIDIHRFDGKIKLALPVDYADNSFHADKLIQGHGWGFDAGVTFYKRKTNNNNFNRTDRRHAYTPYQYRIGLSLLDIGGINYNNNSRLLRFQNTDARWTGLDSLRFKSINEFTEEMVLVLGNDQNTVTEGSGFTLWLPAAVSLQFDYQVVNRFYVNALLVQNLTVSSAQVWRPSSISITPRYETNLIEFSLPFSIHQYGEPQVGFAFRVGYISIGTDRLGSFFNFSDCEGLDIYFSLKAGLCKDQYQKKSNAYERCFGFY